MEPRGRGHGARKLGLDIARGGLLLAMLAVHVASADGSAEQVNAVGGHLPLQRRLRLALGFRPGAARVAGRRAAAKSGKRYEMNPSLGAPPLEVPAEDIRSEAQRPPDAKAAELALLAESVHDGRAHAEAFGDHLRRHQGLVRTRVVRHFAHNRRTKWRLN